MKTLIKNIILFATVSIMFNACDLATEDAGPANVYEKISGTWNISSMNMLGMDIPGDGSTLSFDNCDEPPCTGRDYEATDETTGTFTYKFVEEDSKILIVDEDEKGGNYNATWSILDFDKDYLKITGEFPIFGSMQMELRK